MLKEAEDAFQKAVQLINGKEIGSADDAHNVILAHCQYALFLKGTNDKVSANQEFETILQIAENAGIREAYEHLNGYIEEQDR